MNQNQNKFAFFPFCLIICMFLNTGYISQETEVTISADIGNPKILFAVDELKASFIEKGIKVQINKSTDADIIFSLQPENSALKTEGFSIKRESDRIYIISTDDAGSMYGGLELAEQIRLFDLTGVKETLQNPYMEVRGEIYCLNGICRSFMLLIFKNRFQLFLPVRAFAPVGYPFILPGSCLESKISVI